MTTTLLPDKSKVSRFFPAIMMTLSQVILYLFSNLSTRKGNLPASLLRRHALSNRSRGQNHALKPHPSTPPTTYLTGTTMGDLSDLQKLENYIGGEFLPTSSYIKSYNPSTGEHYLDVPDSGPEDVEKAVEAARKAFKT